MRRQTDLMRAILTNEMARRIIDFVSPIYGNSYVGLWIYQAIGTVLGDVYAIAEQFRHETNPLTSTLLLDNWEDHYGIDRDSSLSIEQRRARIVSKIKSRGSCTPARLVAAVSNALGGVNVEVRENTDKNTFTVCVMENVPSLTPAIDVINRMKPAHLIYDIQIENPSRPVATINHAVAVTHWERFSVHDVDDEDDDDDDRGPAATDDGYGNVALNPLYTFAYADDGDGNITITTVD